MLFVQQIEVFYQHVIQVINGVSLTVPDSDIICLLGNNGAGKTTILKAISGLLFSDGGRIVKGNVEFNGQSLNNRLAHEITKLGIIQVYEGRKTLSNLTTEDNLRAGHIGDRSSMQYNLKMVYELFPHLAKLYKRRAGWLSGGEQQMLVIGRGLMGNPSLMLLDEPSLGLAPIIVKEIFAIIKRINVENNTGILLVEQNAVRALEVAKYGYILENGRIVMDGSAKSIRDNPDIKDFYLGMGRHGSRKSYKDVKHYKRRKRWL